jgi:hypothetical protein
MPDKLTWDEIKRQYPDEWVALIGFDWPDPGELVTGVVHAHSPSHSDLIRMAKGLPNIGYLRRYRQRLRAKRASTPATPPERSCPTPTVSGELAPATDSCVNR